MARVEDIAEDAMKFLKGHRFWMHFPIGVLAAVGTFLEPAWGITLFAGFLAYEFIQEWRKKDHSYKDVIGTLVAYGLTGALWLLIREIVT